MTGNIHRFLSRRDRRPKSTADAHVDAHVAPDVGTFAGFFLPDEENRKKKFEKDEEKTIKTILARLHSAGITMFNEANVDYALRSKATQGNMDDAFRLLLLFEDTHEGLVKSYNPNTKLLGAENRSGVTCYLDALLFAMFARLDSFEAMLYNAFEDPPRKKLAGLMRLWVNLLRDGKLITTDITKILQDALAECGWESAAKLVQQDTSEAFTFITGQLELPLLTLKMDLYHTGKEEPDDDHRFVNERLLEVAILESPVEGSDVITLEDCLENYFNNRIEVKRHMERTRGAMLQSRHSAERLPPTNDEKSEALQVETVEFAVGEMAESPATEVPLTPVKSTLDKVRPGLGRNRADSIFSQRRMAPLDSKASDDADLSTPERQRKASVRTEVLMPAWQFFKLLPWYTDNVPTSDAQVAAHFSHKRPVLGIALKRYQVTHEGVASRLNTYVDIPLEIAVPAFVSDDNIGDDSPLVGNFKLVLQSVVCHRGSSVNSGHYVSLVRGQAANARDGGSLDSRPDSPFSDDEPDPWMLFDDLAKERVTYVNVEQKLKEECPYLLFYQVQPIDDLPPTYEESCDRAPSNVSASPEKQRMLGSFDETDEGDFPDTVIVEDESGTSPNGAPALNTEVVDWSTSTRTSIDINTILDEQGHQPPCEHRGRNSTSSNRSSAGTDLMSPTFGSHKAATSVPVTPVDESRSSFLGLPMSRRGSKAINAVKSKSRPSSQGAEEREGRFGLKFNMSKISNIGRVSSKSDLASMVKTSEEAVTSSATTPVATPSVTPALELSEENVTNPIATNATTEKEKKHSGTASVDGSVASLGILTGGSTESLGSKPDTIAIADVSDEHRKRNWKEKMGQKREERSRLREEKLKGKEEKLSHKKMKKAKTVASEVPDRECTVM
ncbi:hypothetical protein AAFC00_006145 [Neodothiora populina]|uniref:ubiquitinyl hydrolase 1 n=1 Tax=Neodothiora populina TaxID=2781224 RepID=A0ABR3P475_9PEZI